MVWDVQIKAALGSFSTELTFTSSAPQLCVIGPNASGKTSLLKIMIGVYPGVLGHIRVAGASLLESSNDLSLAVEERNVAYVPQGYGLFPNQTVLENVAFGLDRTIPQIERWHRALHQLERLEAVALAARLPGALSGGEQQRVALARALVTQPRALFLDEPLSALDVAARRQTRTFLMEHLQKSATPAIVVTHDLRDVLALDFPVLVLQDGQVVQSGTVNELTENPINDFVAEFFDPAR